jgi:DNA-directed RNA polymerase specialized sigma24 family protein
MNDNELDRMADDRMISEGCRNFGVECLEYESSVISEPSTVDRYRAKRHESRRNPVIRYVGDPRFLDNAASRSAGNRFDRRQKALDDQPPLEERHRELKELRSRLRALFASEREFYLALEIHGGIRTIRSIARDEGVPPSTIKRECDRGMSRARRKSG